MISIGDPNVFINPENIDYVELRRVGVTEVVYVCVGGKEFILGIPLNDFLRVIDAVDVKQFFAG